MSDEPKIAEEEAEIADAPEADSAPAEDAAEADAPAAEPEASA